MKNLLLVAGGGAAGALARYLITLLLATRHGGLFPIPTLVVNVLGCLALGALLGWGEQRELLTEPMRLVLATGFLGSFTTFSTLAVESHGLFHRGSSWLAVVYLLTSVTVGILAVVLGRWLVVLFTP